MGMNENFTGWNLKAHLRAMRHVHEEHAMLRGVWHIDNYFHSTHTE